jgi:hypothetical protein
MKGRIHHLAHNRTYIKVHNNELKKSKHGKEYFPGKRKIHLLPAIRKGHHIQFKQGQHVKFDIVKRDKVYASAFYHGLPLIGTIVGVLIGTMYIPDAWGIFLMILLWTVMGVIIQRIVRSRINLFRDIDIVIEEPRMNVITYSARKNKKK